MDIFKTRLTRGQILLFLFFLVFVVYSNSLFNSFLSDDLFAIPQNPGIGKFSYLFENPIFFARTIPYYLIFKILGPNPFLFHVLNILIHFGVVSMIFAIVSRLYNQKAAFFASALVSVHPILTEGVTWISGGIYPQYTLFLLVSFWFYLESKHKKYALLTSFLFYILAISTSEKAVIFPLILVLYEFALGNIRLNYKKSLSFFGGAFILAILYLGKIQTRALALKDTYYQERGIDNPFLQIPIAISQYLKLIFFPKSLAFYHSELGVSGVEYLIRLFIFLGFIGFVLYSYKKSKHIFFWLSAFLISLSPTLTPFRLSWLVAERYVYFGAICFLTAIAIGITHLSEKKKWKEIVYILFAVVIILLMIRTIIRNIDWKDQDHLWIATGKTSPSSPQNHNNLGDLYARHGDFKKSEAEFKRAIELNPNYADAYHNLGNTYQDTKQYDKALKAYEYALAINSALWQSHQNRGAIYFILKDYKNAEKEFGKAIIIFPKNPILHTNLGIIYLVQGKKQQAEAEFLKVLSIDPSNPKAQIGLAEARK